VRTVTAGKVLGWCGVGSYRYCSGQSEQLLLGWYWGGVALGATDIVVGSENSYCWEGTGVVWCWELQIL